ncbi:DUF2194 domain-containing protein [bacterium]|nr:DUF2194 domain-containing protein [bacterium]
MATTVCFLIILQMAICWLSVDIFGENTEQHENVQVISRSILAVFDSAEEPTADATRIHKKLEVFLNHQGCVVEYHDIAAGLPSDETMCRYRGIITWFGDNTMGSPENYLKWLAKQIDNNIKVVILEFLGASIGQDGRVVDRSLIDEIYKKFGVEYKDDTTDEIVKIELVYKDSEVIEFERKLDFELDLYTHFSQIDNANKNYLVLKRNDIPDSESPVVFTCKAGGIVSPTYVYYRSEENFKTKLRINPFMFFSEAFQLKGMPAPDVTTRNGCRIVFSHIDGDAFISLCRFDTTRLCSEVIYDEILCNYVIPISVSVVVGELITGRELPWIKGEKDLNQIARMIYSLPHIQPASHTYTHPLDWSRKIVAIHIPGYSEKISSETHHILEESSYESLTMELSVANVGDEEFAQKELVDSIEYINTELLSGTEKYCSLVFWSGNCLPQSFVHDVVREKNIRSINGGDPVFDEVYDSYSQLCPLYRPLAGGRQVYTAACNENIYTGLWSGPFYGYASVIDTFQHTESPVRIKPINIYYHFYSGERMASLNALQKVYDYALEQESYPIYTSEYIDSVYDWIDTRLYVLQDGTGYRIVNSGKCRTVRIDHEKRFPDLSRSSGVIGFLFYQDSLYVHLDDSGSYELWLSSAKPTQPYLVKSTAEIKNYIFEKNSVSFDVYGFGAVYCVFKNLVPNSIYVLETTGEPIRIETDSDGTLDVILPENPSIKEEYHVRITLQDGERS